MRTISIRLVVATLAGTVGAVSILGCDRSVVIEGFQTTREIKAGEVLQKSDLEAKTWRLDPDTMLTTTSSDGEEQFEAVTEGFVDHFVSQDELQQYLGKPLTRDLKSRSWLIEPAFDLDDGSK